MRPMVVSVAVVLASLGAASHAGAATITWKGHTWQLTSGGMAGVCQGDPQNVTIDANGYLHLRIVNNGGTWAASELFTTDRLGFGTYQWQVDGPIDTYDKNVVLGLFPYGPEAGIGTDGMNEIDIEYSRWGQASGPNGDWTDYPASGSTIGELSYTFSLGGATLSTSRFTWSSTSIADALLGGLATVDSSAGLIKSWTYAPSNPTVNIPQQALPLGMNLWCFNAPPSDGNPVEIVIRDFTFVPAGSGGTGGAGGTGGVGGAAATGGVGGGGAGGKGGLGGGAGGQGGVGAGGKGGLGGNGAGGKGGIGSGGATGGQGGASTGGAGQTGGTSGQTGGTSGQAGGTSGQTGGTSGQTGGTSGQTGGTSGQTGGGGGGGQSTGSGGDSGGSTGGVSSGCSCAFDDGAAGLGQSTRAGPLLICAIILGRRRRRGTAEAGRRRARELS